MSFTQTLMRFAKGELSKEDVAFREPLHFNCEWRHANPPQGFAPMEVTWVGGGKPVHGENDDIKLVDGHLVSVDDLNERQKKIWREFSFSLVVAQDVALKRDPERVTYRGLQAERARRNWQWGEMLRALGAGTVNINGVPITEVVLSNAHGAPGR